MKEEWKKIDYYNNYEVSSFGRIRNVKRNKILKTSLTSGYPGVELFKNGVGKTTRVHRLVAGAFLDKSFENAIVNHKDSDKTNNHVDNLEWCTHSHNNKHTYLNGYISHSNKAIRCIETQKEFISISECAKEYNLHSSNICKVLKKEYKRTGGYTFEYV